MILYYLYVAFLILALVLVGRMAQIQMFWKLDKDVERFFKPSSVKSVIDPERGAIIGKDGKLLAMSTPLYELFMDCTVRKDYFESKGKDGKRLEKEWQEKAKQFSKGLAAEMGGDGETYWKMIQKGREDDSGVVHVHEQKNDVADEKVSAVQDREVGDPLAVFGVLMRK